MFRVASVAKAKPVPLAASIAAGGVMVGVLFSLMGGRASAEGNQPPPKVFKGGPAFVSLPLESSEQVTHNVKRLRFKLPQDEAVSGLTATSAVLTVSWPKGGWVPVPRPYTPISPLDEPGVLELMVKKYPNGRASGHLHSLVPGDKLLFAVPLKGYPWKPNAYRNITLIAGGCGITPVFQLTQTILRNPDDKTSINLICAANSDEDILLKPELDAFAKQFPDRLKVTYTLSNPTADSPHRKGYVTRELIQEVTSQDSPASTKVFVSGPPAMEESLVGTRWSSGVLSQLGYRRDQIHKF